MGNIINEHQSAYMKGRYTGEIALIFLDILDNCVENDIDGTLLFFLDFEKAIDPLEWNFFFKTSNRKHRV